MKSLQVLVVNFRSQYTDLIGRSLRDLGVRSAILPPERADKWFAKERPQAVILSGSDKSVNDADAPDISDAILNSGVPIFGICYGMQLLAKKFGGEVQSGTGEGNFGQTIITFNSGNEDGGLWYGLWNSGDNRHVVHASHGDVVTRIPLDFKRIAKPNAFHRGCMGMADLKRKIWGVQFHPEVEDTIDGKRMLSNFVFKIAGCEKDWSPRNLAEEIRETTIEAIGDRKAIVGFSGGVDSTSVTALLSKVLEKRLEAFIIDGGNLREREMEKIVRHAWATGITEPPLVVRAADKFVPAIAASIHAEEKRKAFRLVYQNILLTEARRFGASCIIQGSLAPDLIESGETGSATIVSHHNVGLNFEELEQIHPFKNLFKHEVRALAQELGLPESVYNRQPFPGPGLFVRIVGQPVTYERLALVRWADARVCEISKASGDYQKMSQLVVALLCLDTGGVKGDARSYKPMIGVRGLVTWDFMTGRGYQLPPEVRREITQTLTKHPEIGKVGYFEGDKPPERTEFE